MPGAWLAVDSPECRRAVTLYWGADNRLSSAPHLMRATIADWHWSAPDPA
jgi:hypothetical protein